MRAVLVHPGSVFEKRGLFHGWGLSCVESCDGNMTESLAIVEFNDGSVTTIPPHLVKFLTPPPPENTTLLNQFAGQIMSGLFAHEGPRYLLEIDPSSIYEVAGEMIRSKEGASFSAFDRINELEKEIAELKAREAKP